MRRWQKCALIGGQKRSIESANGSGVNVDAAVQFLKKTIPKQIKEQLTWKTSCKTGKAMWKYEGVCANAAVFKTLMNGAIKFKRKSPLMNYIVFSTANILAKAFAMTPSP